MRTAPCAFASFLLLALLSLSCSSDPCSSGPDSITPAQAKKCLSELQAEVSEDAFSEAAEEDSTKLVELYVAAGLPVQEAFEEAVESGSESSVSILLEYGAQVEDEMLQRPVSDGYTTMTQILLEHGADPNAGSRPGPGSIFTSALKHDDPELANLILDHGAEPETARGLAFDPISKAVCFGHWGVAKRLLRETDADASLLIRARSGLKTGQVSSQRVDRVLHDNCSENIMSAKAESLTGS